MDSMDTVYSRLGLDTKDGFFAVNRPEGFYEYMTTTDDPVDYAVKQLNELGQRGMVAIITKDEPVIMVIRDDDIYVWRVENPLTVGMLYKEYDLHHVGVIIDYGSSESIHVLGIY